MGYLGILGAGSHAAGREAHDVANVGFHVAGEEVVVGRALEEMTHVDELEELPHHRHDAEHAGRRAHGWPRRI